MIMPLSKCLDANPQPRRHPAISDVNESFKVGAAKPFQKTEKTLIHDLYQMTSTIYTVLFFGIKINY